MTLKNQGNNQRFRGNGKKRNNSGLSKNSQNHNNGNKNPTEALDMGQDPTNHTFGLPPYHRLQL